jgi:cytochrome c peroxidase
MGDPGIGRRTCEAGLHIEQRRRAVGVASRRFRDHLRQASEQRALGRQELAAAATLEVVELAVRLAVVLGCASVVFGAAILQAAGPRLPPGLDLYRPVPEENPITPAKIALGRRLFHDRRLSRDGSRSCASCHDPRRAFTDGRTLAVGPAGAVGRRNVPTIVNRAWGRSFFWDGRASTLEQQALLPILNPIELGALPDDVVTLSRSRAYRDDFQKAFGADPVLDDVARALATYVRTIVAGDSPYDRFAAGDESALGRSARRGLGLFTGRAGCAACHSGPTFTDEQFHNTGVAWRPSTGSGQVPSTGSEPSDIGRAAVSGRDDDRGAFKTPTLREVARTAPYMHDGSLATLDEVIDYYDRGGQRNPGLDSMLRPLGLTLQDKRDLGAFLGSLTGRVSDGR